MNKYLVIKEYMDYTHSETDYFDTLEEATNFFNESVKEHEPDYDDCFELLEVTDYNEETGEWDDEEYILTEVINDPEESEFLNG